MADFKGHMIRHLRSARIWLTRAEESFDKDSKVRGELDLFLAQAELQHARETSLSRPERPRQSLLRHTASFVIAVVVAAAGFGAYWGLSERNAAMPVPLAAQEAKATPVAPKALETAAPVRVEEQRPAPPKATSNTPSEAVQPVSRPGQPERPQPAEKENLLSPDEMQSVIRAAGKSLRGQ